MNRYFTMYSSPRLMALVVGSEELIEILASIVKTTPNNLK